MSSQVKDVVIPLHGGHELQVGNNGYEGVRSAFWRYYRDRIETELQKELDRGWVPISSIGPSNIEIRTYRKTYLGDWSDPISCLLGLIVIIGTAGLVLLVLLVVKTEFAVATEFRVKMRKS